MDTQELVTYVTKQLQNGQSKEAVTTQLVSQGLQLAQIETAFQAIQTNNSPITSEKVVQTPQQTNIKDLRKKEGRGILLIILMAITLLMNIISLPGGFAFFSAILKANLLRELQAYLLLTLQGLWGPLSLVLTIGVVIGIWYWKKKAIFLGVLIVFINIVSSIWFFLGPPQFSSLQDFIVSTYTYSAIFNLVMVFLWAWALKRKWHLFT